MIRPKRASAKEHSVKLVIRILEKEVAPKFGDNKKLSCLSIHKHKDNKYFRILLSIAEYAEKFRGDNKNPLRSIIKDYLISVYQYYQRFNRIPTTLQLSPAISNVLRFEEWVYSFMREREEEYLIKHVQEENEVHIFDQQIDAELPTITEV